MGLFDRPDVLLNFCEIALDANTCLDLPVLSSRLLVLKSDVEHCAVPSTRKPAYGSFENFRAVNART